MRKRVVLSILAVFFVMSQIEVSAINDVKEINDLLNQLWNIVDQTEHGFENNKSVFDKSDIDETEESIKIIKKLGQNNQDFIDSLSEEKEGIFTWSLLKHNIS